MKRPTFTTATYVEISLCGVPQYHWDHVMCPDDQGLVRKLQAEMSDGRLPYPEKLRTAGGGVYIGGWRPEDAPRVIAWLSEYADRVEADE